MAELAPGVFVTPFLEPGTAYVVAAPAALGAEFNGFGEQGRGLAIPKADWERIDAAERERILDTVTRDSAEAGLERLSAWLNPSKVRKPKLRHGDHARAAIDFLTADQTNWDPNG